MDETYVDWVARKIIAVVEENPLEEDGFHRLFFQNPELAEKTVRNIMCESLPVAKVILGVVEYYDSAREVAAVFTKVLAHFSEKQKALDALK